MAGASFCWKTKTFALDIVLPKNTKQPVEEINTDRLQRDNIFCNIQYFKPKLLRQILEFANMNSVQLEYSTLNVNGRLNMLDRNDGIPLIAPFYIYILQRWNVFSWFPCNQDYTTIHVVIQTKQLTQNGSPPNVELMHTNRGSWIKMNKADRSDAKPVNLPKCEKWYLHTYNIRRVCSQTM